jgi:hypothetical protein
MTYLIACLEASRPRTLSSGIQAFTDRISLPRFLWPRDPPQALLSSSPLVDDDTNSISQEQDAATDPNPRSHLVSATTPTAMDTAQLILPAMVEDLLFPMTDPLLQRQQPAAPQEIDATSSADGTQASQEVASVFPNSSSVALISPQITIALGLNSVLCLFLCSRSLLLHQLAHSFPSKSGTS